MTPKQSVSKCLNHKVDVGKKTKILEKQNVKFIPRILRVSPELHSGSSNNVEKLVKQSTFQAFWRPRPNPSVVSESNFYFKQNFLKQQLWRAKDVSDDIETSSMSSEEWFDAISEDEIGQSRTERAWISTSQ